MINNILSEYFHYLQIQMQVIFICIAAWRKVPQAAAAPCVKIPSPRLPQRRPKPSFLLLTTTLSIMKKHLLRSALYGIAAAILAACQSRSIQTFPQPDTSVINEPDR